MSRTELDAAGIDDPALRSAYRRCRALNARHGRTYFLATRLLAPAQRPAVHALYGFARWADDVVDAPIDAGRSPEAQLADRRARLDRLATLLFDRLEGRDPTASGPGDPIPDGDDVLAAVSDTARRHGIDAELFRDFLRSMRMDLSVTDYPDRAALAGYVRGSADVIGLQMLPVLGTVVPHEQAAPRAAALGTAFQLTNFVRDIAEDLDRGRVYLPADELAAFGVDRDVLDGCRRTGRTDPRVRDALADQIARIREIYRFAAPGVDMLHPVSRPCVSTALRLYGGILDEVEAGGYAVFATRATVPDRRRVAVAAPALLRAVWARRGRRDRSVGDVPDRPMRTTP